MEFTKKSFDEFRVDYKKALELLEKKYEIKCDLGNISYNDNSFRIKAEFSKSSGDDMLDGYEKFKSLCIARGITPNVYNKRFDYNGKKFIITGIKARARKNCLIVERDNKKYVIDRKILSTVELY